MTISTTRHRYGGGRALACYGGEELAVWWDEEVSAYYRSGPRAGEDVNVYRERPYESLEEVMFVCELEEGELLQILKDDQVAKYVLIVAGEIIQLAPDFEPVVNDYVRLGLSVQWLLAQEYVVNHL